MSLDKKRFLVGTGAVLLALGLAGGVRQQTLLFLLPL